MIGRTIGAYRIESLLGQGGMGAVYRGLDLMLDRPVAIKALRADIAASAGHVERFRQEARTLARLLDPHIATLYAFLRDGDDLYMVMEFVEGETFEALLHRERRLAPDRALPLFRQALRGIDHAHRRGIVHRDVKPANFMLTPGGTVKVMDFGISRLLGSARMTQTRHAIGTAEYMAPEQVRAREVDARTDVYALGVLLYEMVTGRVPFDAPSAFETMQAHLQVQPPAPSRWVPDLPTEVARAILTALAKDPADRFPSVAAFRDALPDLEAPRPIGSPAERPSTRPAAPTTPAPPTVVAERPKAAPPAESLDTDEPPAQEIGERAPGSSDEAPSDDSAPPVAAPPTVGDEAPAAAEPGETLPDDDPVAGPPVDPETGAAPEARRQSPPPTVVADPLATVEGPRHRMAPPTTVVAGTPATVLAPAPGAPGRPAWRSLRPVPRAVLAVAGAALVVAMGLWTWRPSPTPDRATDDRPERVAEQTAPGGPATPVEGAAAFALPTGPPPAIDSAPTGPTDAAEGRPPAERAPEPRRTPAATPDQQAPPPDRRPEPPPPPAPAPEPALRPQTGTARIVVRPFGDIYLDGQRLARATNAAVSAELAPGTYTVRATHPDFGEITETVRVQAGRTADVQLQFATPVEVTVTSDPLNAEILLDGRRTGRYTPAAITVPPGRHTIGAEREDTSASTTITITAGQSPARVRLTLQTP
ncbi:protein kinase domain-containing protein [Rubrivirga sp. IMCC43871]|uniref:serine/threonine-protein kinase n=1 Tax=Rubrivirga sp. IMCC43871 TaxID=3391575 RepID=UPI0039901B13